jgi:hypothetical protein
MRIQSSHYHAERGLDAYFSPPEATAALLAIEHGQIAAALVGARRWKWRDRATAAGCRL